MEDTTLPTELGQGERALWIEVVLRAIGDIADEPLDSTEYKDAAAFFTAGGDWARSRDAVALYIDLHADDLQRAGRMSIAKRRRAEGLPLQTIPGKVSAAAQTPFPRLEALPAPERRPVRESPGKRDRNWWIAKFMTQRAA